MKYFIDIETLPPFPREEFIENLKQDINLGLITLPTRKKVQASIDAEINERINDYRYLERLWESLSFDPNFGEIFCIVIKEVDEDPILFRENNEIETLKKFQDYFLESKNPSLEFVGYNIKNFDLPFLYKRLLIRFCKVPFFPLPPYRYNRSLIDLCEMWDCHQQKIKISNSQKNVTSLLKVDTPNPITGAEVLSRYLNEDYKAIEDHCIADVNETEALYKRLTLRY